MGIGTTDPGSFLLKVAGEMSAGFNKIREVAAPVATSDAATKGYVDAQVAGNAGGGSVVTIGWGESSTPLVGGESAPVCPSGWTEVYKGFWAVGKLVGSGSSESSPGFCVNQVAQWLSPSTTDFISLHGVGGQYDSGGNWKSPYWVTGGGSSDYYNTFTCRVCVK